MNLQPTGFASIYVYVDDQKNPYFLLTVKEALTKINSKPVGAALLTAISNAAIAPHQQGFKVKIVRPDVHCTIGSPGVEGGSRAVPFLESGARGGGGSLAACFWNPNIFSAPGPAGARPPFIGLAHELTHCMHSLNGTMKQSYDDEEKFTVGLAPFTTTAICENTIRAEHGIALRTAY